MVTTKQSATVERRFVPGLEVREASADQKAQGLAGVIVGYAAVFNSWSRDLGGFREMIRPGAFKASLDRGDDIRALTNHLATYLLGRRSAGTLRIKEDDKGLGYEIDVPDTSAGRDTLTSIRRKDMSGSSFGFRTVDDKWTEETKDGTQLVSRELITVDLFDVGPCVFPAYDDTVAEARSLLEGARAGKRLGTEAPPDRARRDRLVARHRHLASIWG